MSFPVSAGHPVYSENYIPTPVFSKTFLARFYAASVAWDICNTDYEKEVKTMGETVTIRQFPDVTVRNYTKGMTLVPESPNADPITFAVDKGKYFDITVDDVDELQSGNIMGKNFFVTGNEQMKNSIDTDILQGIYASADTYNCGTTAGYKTQAIDLGTTGAPEPISKSNIADYIAYCSIVLDERDVPDDGNRFIVLPSSAKGILLMSDLNNASMTGDGKSIYLNGKINDNYCGFKVYVSNNLKTVAETTGTSYYIPFGHKMSLAMATQLTKTRIIENDPARLGTYYQAFQIYGYKVVKDTAFGILYARFTM